MRSDRPARPDADSGAAESSRRAPGLPAPLPLATGVLDERDAAELDALKEQIRVASGLFCKGYKEKCLRRRLGVRMRARGVHRYRDYAALLRQDPEEYARFLDAVTINVSKFFRNPEMWQVLREQVLDDLFAAPAPVRIWSAGSASGEEPYSLAILLREHAEATGRPDVLERFSVVGSDIDAAALQRARAAEYPEAALAETPAAARRRWFSQGPPFVVADEVRSMVRFRRTDLIEEPFRGSFRLILCRNVFIYFEREVQERLLWKFYQALQPGGYLVLGKVETLLGPVVGRLEPISTRQRVYRKT